MTLDLKNRCLRLYRSALHKLGDPDYIQFLVSPEQRKIAVIRAEGKDSRSQKVYWTKLRDNSSSCEFYSKELLEMLKRCFFDKNDLHSLRVKGEVLSDQCILIFDLVKAEPITSEADAVKGTV